MSDEMLAFVDTNTFLHYLALEHVDWPAVLGARRVTLMIAPVIIRELDKHKSTSSSRKLRKRAAAAIARLNKWADAALPAVIRPGVQLGFVVHEPGVDFDALRLNRFSEDDHLVASIVEYSGQNPQAKLVLVTADVGLKLKARDRRIAVVSLPDSLALPDEPDPNEIRVKELEARLQQYENELPELSLVFEDGKRHVIFQINPIPPATEPAEARTAELRQKYPLWDESGRSPRPLSDQAANFLGTPNLEDVRAYNFRLRAYYDEYAQYLQELKAFEEQKTRTLCLKLWLSNTGGVPAEDVDIFMHFPDGFALVEERDLPKPPKEPTQPPLPQTRLEAALSSAALSSAAVASAAGINPRWRPDLSGIGPRPNVSRPKIKRSSSYDVECHVQRLKHNFLERLAPMHVIFDSLDTANSFGIQYRILASNHPSPIEGAVHVVVEKYSSPEAGGPERMKEQG